MGSRELLLFTFILLASLLSFFSANGFPSVTGGYERRGTSSRKQPSAPQWQLLTNRNFSSQIRLHQHILLMVTVPWYGESRSLMKEISHLVGIKQKELGHLSLMVVYRNSEKLLADVLGANEGITLLYYHYSMAYKYRGRLSAHNILSSVYQVMPLGLEDFPLKHVQTKEDLDSFRHSTDKAILLLEFCGWSTKLLHKQNNESNGNDTYMQSFSENVGDLLDDQNRDAKGTIILDNQELCEDLENEELTCRVGMGLSTCPWDGEFTWVNESVSKGTRISDSSLGFSCTQQEFQQFESFFTKFMSTTKEYSLPPERQRFGLVTEMSLLPFLGVSDPETWLIVLQFPSCPNCSKVVQEVDDLHAILKMDDSLVMELGIVDQNSQFAFPANRPSVILFVDRSSSSAEIKNASKLALETFKQFAHDCHLSTQVNNNSKASLAQVTSGIWHKNTRDPFSHTKSKVSPANKFVKLKDDMAIMIMNEGENTSLDDIASQAQGSQFYNILAELLHRREPAVKTKETKISLLAKEVGFQLLSDDFHVQVVDILPSHTEEHTQPDKMIESDTVSLVDQNSKQPEESTEQSSDLSGYITMNNEERPELVHMEGGLRQNQEVVPSHEGSTSSTDNECMAVCQQEGSESTCSADNSSQSSEKSPLVEERTDKENVHNLDYSLSEVFSSGFAKNLVHETSQVVLVEEGSAEHAEGSIEMVRSSEPFVGHQPFLGSFFFSDGNHQFLETMTARSKIPSLILLDPLLQRHYVLSEKENITYSSIANFIDQFLDGNLTPYQKSESDLAGSRETPHPPFVNLDFHEADSIPRVTAKTFCELIVGFKHCETKSKLQPSNTENLRPAYNVDVLVLFSTTWCGFCQRMELVVREVYRAFKSFHVLLKNESLRRNSRTIKENNEDILIELPSIYLLDCSLNDCSSFLLPLGKEERYPILLLFPAGNKDAISYEGYLSVGSVIEFLISHGSKSHHLNMHKGVLWTQKPKPGKSTHMFGDTSSPLEDNFYEIIISERTSGDNGSSANNLSYDQRVVAGSVLTATDKLLNSFPFNNSTILIVTADEDQGFQGLIINKQINWNIFKEFSQETESIKLAPLSYGGPVVVDGLPLVSLVRNPRAGYTTVHAGLYFGNAVATSLSIKEINSGKQSATDYWFFLGYSSWGWSQLFSELAEGAWHLSESPIASLDWPHS